MKMQELERRTGVSRQMVQFYLAHGLLPEPVRPKPNVAVYSEEHVRAIEAIRRLQIEGRLTIQEIKQALSGVAAKSPSQITTLPHLDTLFAARAGVDSTRVPIRSLEGRNPHAATDAQRLMEIGAIEIHSERGEPQLSMLDAQIVATWGDMRSAGFNEERGFSPQVVAMYLKAARELASAEIEIFNSRIGADVPVEKRATMAETASKLMLNVFTVLRMKAEIEAFRQAEEEAATS